MCCPRWTALTPPVRQIELCPSDTPPLGTLQSDCRGAFRQSRPCDKRRLIGCARKVALIVWEYRGAQEFRVRLPQGRRKLPLHPPSLQAGIHRSASVIYGISLISPVHCVRSRYAPIAARREAQHADRAAKRGWSYGSLSFGFFLLFAPRGAVRHQRLTCAPYYQPGEARIRVGDRSLSRFDFRRAAARRDVGLWRDSDPLGCT